MVDIQTHKIIDMLESREMIALLTGLSQHMVKKYTELPICEIPDESQTVRGRGHEDAVKKLTERANGVKALRESGLSITEITQKTGFTTAVANRYLSADFSPVNAHYGKQREGKLEPFRADVMRWKAQGLTYPEIHARICQQGYMGTQDAIRGFVSKEHIHMALIFRT